ncbi:polymorphic toxin-type HINT domain-containing protein [Paenibacillus sp. SI8]|uniref:polymorphic toxin-type HINT domain-containing protein n=1 Tax=unclassified Paenibacillus TaxID=185978 RepID=UPI003467AE73
MSWAAGWNITKGEIAGFGSGYTALLHKETYTGVYGLLNGLSSGNISVGDVAIAIGNSAMEPIQYASDHMDNVLNGDPSADEAYQFGYSVGQIENMALGATASAKAIVGMIKNSPKVALAMGLCQCFTAGTKVLTEDGEKPIEEVKVGDKVLAKDDETGEQAYKEVTGLFQKQADEIYHLYIGNEIIEVTGKHPFWLADNGWTLVEDLKVGDLLLSSTGEKLAIKKIEIEKRNTIVYNFEVDEFHSYFVSNLGIWVHNCSINWKGFSKGQLSTHFEKHGVEFGDISQNDYLSMAKAFGAEESSSFQTDTVGNFLIKYDPGTRRMLVGHAKSREIRTFYRADDRDADPFAAARQLAQDLSR